MAGWGFSKYGFAPKSLTGQFDKFLFGEKPKVKQLQNLNPQQQEFHNSILSQLMGMQGEGGGFNQAQQFNQNILGGGPRQGGQEGAYNQFSQPYLQQFQEQVLPMIAERFAGGGALSSSGFGQAIGGAGAGLQSKLAQLFSSLQQNAAQQEYGQFNQMSQFGLNPTFSHYEKPGSQGFGPQFLASLVKGGLGG